MKYTVTVEIDVPLPEVVALFDNPDNWPKWRDGFVSAEAVRGSPGVEGSSTKLVNRVGGRDTEMIETVEGKSLPNEMTCIYAAPGYWFGAWNKATNRFRAVEPRKSAWESGKRVPLSGPAEGDVDRDAGNVPQRNAEGNDPVQIVRGEQSA